MINLHQELITCNHVKNQGSVSVQGTSIIGLTSLCNNSQQSDPPSIQDCATQSPTTTDNALRGNWKKKLPPTAEASAQCPGLSLGKDWSTEPEKNVGW